jgi:hypothetical protein
VTLAVVLVGGGKGPGWVPLLATRLLAPTAPLATRPLLPPKDPPAAQPGGGSDAEALGAAAYYEPEASPYERLAGNSGSRLSRASSGALRVPRPGSASKSYRCGRRAGRPGGAARRLRCLLLSQRPAVQQHPSAPQSTPAAPSPYGTDLPLIPPLAVSDPP